MAVEVARLGHDVIVLTQSEFEADISREKHAGRLPPGLQFDIVMPRWLARLRDLGLRCGLPAITWHVTSVLWQFCALRHVQRRYRGVDFDVIHHVTFAGIRHPTLLTLLNVPVVLGPLGGGDRIPMALRRSFPWKYWFTELARDLHNASLRLDPMTRSAFHRARLIFLRTKAAAVAVPPRDRHKTRVRVGLGVEDMMEAAPRARADGEPLRLLYAGGLLHLKGIHLGLHALDHALRQSANVNLTIAGEGPARAHLERLTARLGLEPYVAFAGQLPRRELLNLYAQHHALLFPSMRDAGGMVVLEAWSQALPVLCLALAGPGQMVDDTCGRVVQVADRDEIECARALGQEIAVLAANEPLRQSLAKGALTRYRQSSWRQVVAELYAEISESLSDTSAGARSTFVGRSPPCSGTPQGWTGEPAAEPNRRVWLRSAVLALLVLPFLNETSASACPVGAIVVGPGESIQAAVDAAPAFTTFCLKSGVHRMQVVMPKPGQHFVGEGHTVLNGSRLVRSFVAEGAYWVAGGVLIRDQRSGRCMKAYPTCDFSEVVLIDDQMLVRVVDKGDLGPGRFWADPARALLYIADDPTGRVVEVTAATFAFASSSPDVRISDVIVEKYATPAQKGAIDAQNGSNWIAENCVIRRNSGAGISVGTGARVLGCDIHHNGQIGITGAGNDIRIEGNRIWENNLRGFSMGWEAGGAKISLADGVVFRANHVHDNRGPGLWCDGDCRNVVYEDNRIERNHEAGIFHEISFRAVVRNNVLRRNGMNDDGWFWGNDILVAGSEGVEIYGNVITVARGLCAIMLIDQGRADNGTLYKTRNNKVHDNDVTFHGAPCAGGTSDVAPSHENYRIIASGNNSFDRNTYRVPREVGRYRFVWGQSEDLDFEGFRTRGLERAGQLVLY